MIVSQLMTKRLISVRPMDSVEEATRLLRQRGVRHLAVIDRHRLVGIISDRDLKRALDPAKTSKRIMSVGGLYFMLEPILVEEIMTRDPVTIDADHPAQEAARVMLEHRFGALPVISRGRVVGIITESDLLRYFAEKLESLEAAEPRKKKVTAKSKPKPRSKSKSQSKPAGKRSQKKSAARKKPAKKRTVKKRTRK